MPFILVVVNFFAWVWTVWQWQPAYHASAVLGAAAVEVALETPVILCLAWAQ